MSDFEAGTHLAPGELYVAVGRVSRREMRRAENYIGATCGGVKLTYTKKSEIAEDRHGDCAGEIGTSGRVKLRGTLSRITPEAVSRLLGELGGTVYPTGDVRIAHFPGASAGQITVYFVCPTIGGETEFYAVCGTADELSLGLGSCDADGIGFTLTAFCTGQSPSLIFIPGGETA